MALNWIEGVLKRSQHTGSNLLLLVLLADEADRESGVCNPSMTKLARLMRSSERNVRYRMQELKKSGELAVKNYGAANHTNLYALNRSLLGEEAGFRVDTERVNREAQFRVDSVYVNDDETSSAEKAEVHFRVDTNRLNPEVQFQTQAQNPEVQFRVDTERVKKIRTNSNGKHDDSFSRSDATRKHSSGVSPGIYINNYSPSTVEENEKDEKKKKNIYTAEFLEWWEAWPKKGDTKWTAFTAWRRLTRDEKDLAVAGVAIWTPYYQSIENRLIPNASTWLNQRRWENDPPPPERALPRGRTRPSFSDRVRQEAGTEVIEGKWHETN